jgi:uncharacterized protein (DUF1810 family)
MTPDPYDLQRFVEAQRSTYDIALAEVRNGAKRSHWMWFIFPQFNGLGMSPRSIRYSIKSVAEAKVYLLHALLGPRLIEIAQAALDVDGASAREIFGTPDDAKLKSCATLFAHASLAGSVFHDVLHKYFEGRPDERTMQLLSDDERRL